MTNGRNILLLLACCVLITGCSGGRFIVKKELGGDGEGFKYYLPKPYLLVSNVVYKVGQDKEAVTRVAKVIYLPDPNEKYSINVEGGTGNFDGKLTFTDGWMLSQVNQQYDTQTAQTIQALASLVKEVKPPMGIFEISKEVAPSPPPEFELYEIDLITKKLTKFTFGP